VFVFTTDEHYSSDAIRRYEKLYDVEPLNVLSILRGNCLYFKFACLLEVINVTTMLTCGDVFSELKIKTPDL
jgi:hypothetical protein